METLHNQNVHLLAMGVKVNSVHQECGDLDEASKQTRGRQLGKCIPDFLASDNKYSELVPRLDIETPLVSSVQDFMHILRALCNAHYQGKCHLRQLSRSEVSQTFPRLVVENGFVEYMRNSDFVEVKCSSTGHFKFYTTSKPIAKKYVLSESSLTTHADPTARVYYLKSEKNLQ